MHFSFTVVSANCVGFRFSNQLLISFITSSFGSQNRSFLSHFELVIPHCSRSSCTRFHIRLFTTAQGSFLFFLLSHSYKRFKIFRGPRFRSSLPGRRFSILPSCPYWFVCFTLLHCRLCIYTFIDCSLIPVVWETIRLDFIIRRAMSGWDYTADCVWPVMIPRV